MSNTSIIVPHVFSITPAQAEFSGILAYACTIPGTCLCFLVLVAYGFAALFKKSRAHLDRVSFRILTYALFFNVLFGIAFSVTAAQTGPGSLCNFGAFAVNLTLSFSTFFTTCIAINLQLVLVHGVNGKMMEKYYVIGTTILSLALTVPAYGLNQFGWDEQNSTCWFKNPSDKLRLRWLIGTQSFWILLAATVETICSCIVLYWMAVYHLTTRYLQKASQRSEQGSGQSSGLTTTTKIASSLWSGWSSRTVVSTQARKYHSVILRIALYPIVSLMMNYSTIALDLNQTIQGVHSQLDFRLLVLDLILYGLRTAVYAVLAAYDPSFVNAIRELRGIRPDRSEYGHPTLSRPQFASGRPIDTTLSATQGQVTINVELQTMSQLDDLGDKSTVINNDPEAVTTGHPGRVTDHRRTFVTPDLDEDRKFRSQL